MFRYYYLDAVWSLFLVGQFLAQYKFKSYKRLDKAATGDTSLLIVHFLELFLTLWCAQFKVFMYYAIYH